MNKVTPVTVLVSCVIGLALAGVIYAVAFQPKSEPVNYDRSSLEDVGLTDAITFELDRERKVTGLRGTLPSVPMVIPRTQPQRPVPAYAGGGVRMVPPTNQ